MNRSPMTACRRSIRLLIDELGRDFTVKMAGIMAESRTETKAMLAEGIDGKKVEMLDAPEEHARGADRSALAD
jgi:hypothetical protein